MGSAQTVSETKKAKNPKGSIELYGEICGSWGFGGKVASVKNQIIDGLVSSGYDVTYTLKPLDGGNGEYYLYKVVDGKRKPVFSNSKGMAIDGCIYGYQINSRNSGDIIQAILSS